MVLRFFLVDGIDRRAGAEGLNISNGAVKDALAAFCRGPGHMGRNDTVGCGKQW